MALILGAFGSDVSHMSGWREVQQAGQQLGRRRNGKPARVVGVDGAWVNGTGLLVAVDLGDGNVLALAQIDEQDSDAVAAWVRALQQEHGMAAMVSDDLAVYKQVAQDLGLQHQIGQFYVRRWVGRTLRQLQDQLSQQWQPVLDRLREVLTTLPRDGDKVLYQLWEQLPGRTSQPNERRTPLEKLRALILRLSQDWQRSIEFSRDQGIPWTNNRTEQMIGRIKH